MPNNLLEAVEEVEQAEELGEVVEGREIALIEDEEDEDLTEEALETLYRESVDNMTGEDMRPEDEL